MSGIVGMVTGSRGVGAVAARHAMAVRRGDSHGAAQQEERRGEQNQDATARGRCGALRPPLRAAAVHPVLLRRPDTGHHTHRGCMEGKR